MKRFAVVTVYHDAHDAVLLSSTMESKEGAEEHLNALAKGAAELGYDVTVYHDANDVPLLSTMESKGDAEEYLNTLAKGVAELGYDVSSFGVGERPYEPYYLGELCVLAWLPETPEDHEQDMSIMLCMVH